MYQNSSLPPQTRVRSSKKRHDLLETPFRQSEALGSQQPARKGKKKYRKKVSNKKENKRRKVASSQQRPVPFAAISFRPEKHPNGNECSESAPYPFRSASVSRPMKTKTCGRKPTALARIRFINLKTFEISLLSSSIGGFCCIHIFFPDLRLPDSFYWLKNGAPTHLSAPITS